AIKTATGFDVAWKIPGTTQFTFWATDANGSYSGNLTGLVDGSTASVKSFETIFHQDLNGDGVIGSPSSASPAAAQSATQPAASGNTLVISSGFSGELIGFGSTADQIDVKDVTFASLRTQFGAPDGVLSLTDGTHST
ncbi:hypothetical protein G3V76_24165, partial [Escherichia coli]|nr:hypothetical protein [Escherichia coli]